MVGIGGGRGNITMSFAALNALITEQVAQGIAAHTAQHRGAQQNQQGCTYKAFLDCKPLTFTGAEGAVGLLRWIEKVESVFAMCKCSIADRVGYATGTFKGQALLWWNS